ncbi:MAG TPA: DNA methyltransferase [Candidatus Limnocylindria bacterium]|nr:DNA methyltransferase [Candidatus Limnocylindria bacterium]
MRVALPFQTVETVNESAQERQRTLDFFSEGRDPGWRNRLIWGDKKYVLPALLPEFQGKVDLIYIDPPYATGSDFSFRVELGDKDFTKIPSVIEQKAYRDTWAHGLDSYLKWFSDAAAILYDLLAPTGSMYVHLDWHTVHYVKALLDEIFVDGFQREIIWRIGWVSGYKSTAKNWIRNHDTILFYVKTPGQFTFNKEYVPYPTGYKRRGEDEPSEGPGYPMEDVWNANPFEFALKGEQSLDSIQIKSFSQEKTGFETQKNESVLARVMRASSKPNDLVLDCFVGSGTTAAVAEKLGRRWIAADLGRFAIHTARKRLLALQGVKPFVVQNLGKYERQAWQAAEFGSTPEEVSRRYRNFILQLYHATPVTGYNWIHGTKAGRAVHVGAVDAPVSPGDVQQMAVELAKMRSSAGAGGPKALDVLGWDFAFELNEVAKQQAARAGIELHFFRIPHDVMDKRAVAGGDISFFELAALSVKLAKKGRIATVTLTDFVIPLDDVPDDIQKAVKDWSEWIDYWAIDWDNRNDTFHNVWQSYRSRATPKLERSASHTYDAPGTYSIVVKVIDILGNDTTKTLSVEVR